jgi:hypothetical protein
MGQLQPSSLSTVLVPYGGSSLARAASVLPTSSLLPVPPPAEALAEMEISFMDVDRDHDAKRKLSELGLASLGDNPEAGSPGSGQSAVTPMPQRYNVWGLNTIEEEIDRPPQDGDGVDPDL